MNHFLNVEMEFSQLIPPCSAYMRHRFGSALVRVMLVACSVPSHYLNQHWFVVNYTLGNKIQWNSNRNTKLFIHENVFEHVVYEMAAILSQPQCVYLHHKNETTPLSASMARWVGMPLKSKRYFRLRSDFGSCLDNYGMLELLLKTTDAVMLNEIIHITLSIWWDTFIKLIQYQFEASDT